MTQPDLSSLLDGITVFFVTTDNSEFAVSQAKNLESSSSTTTIVFIDVNDIPQEINEIIQQNSDLAKRKLRGDFILFTKKNGDKFKYLQYREKPEAKHDWVEVATKFENHYNNTQPIQEGVWQWGQIVPEDGEYLCRDCGYIETFVAGQVFPVCEVCLAGDPEGPLDLNDEFWEKL